MLGGWAAPSSLHLLRSPAHCWLGTTRCLRCGVGAAPAPSGQPGWSQAGATPRGGSGGCAGSSWAQMGRDGTQCIAVPGAGDGWAKGLGALQGSPALAPWGGEPSAPRPGGVRGSRMPQGPGRSFDTALAAAFRLLCWTTQSLCFVCTQMAESPPPPPSSGVPAPHRGQSPGCQDGTPVPAPHTGQEGCSAPPTPLSAVEMLPGQCGEGLDWARPPQA